jgi:hypothetical protein
MRDILHEEAQPYPSILQAVLYSHHTLSVFSSVQRSESLFILRRQLSGHFGYCAFGVRGQLRVLLLVAHLSPSV